MNKKHLDPNCLLMFNSKLRLVAQRGSYLFLTRQVTG